MYGNINQNSIEFYNTRINLTEAFTTFDANFYLLNQSYSANATNSSFARWIKLL